MPSGVFYCCSHVNKDVCLSEKNLFFLFTSKSCQNLFATLQLSRNMGLCSCGCLCTIQVNLRTMNELKTTVIQSERLEIFIRNFHGTSKIIPTEFSGEN